MLPRSSSTRRRYSSIDTCGSHWKGLCGFGMKQDVLTVIRTPRCLFGEC